MRKSLLTVAAVLLSATSALAAPPDPQALAKRIDHQLAASWKADGIVPAPPADDAEFLRRAYLDLTGRIPAVRDVHEFLADRDPDKRRKLVEQLLANPRHASHFATIWSTLLLAEVGASADARYFRPGFEAWLRERWRAGTGYDQLVRELLTVPIAAEGKPAEAVFREPDRPNPLAFYAVKAARPENLAATTTRLFLGIQLECAQCHDHPFAKWTRDQFWNQAAFFAGIERQGRGLFAFLTEAPGRREVIPSEGKKPVRAVFLDGREPAWKPDVSPRVALAEWITAPDNPFFARAAVNRLWGQLFGIGLVDPVDDFHDEHPPSHPALLDELARSFVAAKFDVGYVIRAMCLSQAYQRTSARTHPSQDDPRRFARMAVKGLSGEQFFDSLALATGYRHRNDRGAFADDRNSARARFLAQFAPQGRLSEPETSILQALTLMNGRFVNEATTVETSATLTAITGTPLMSTAERIETLYLATLSRKPAPAELERLLRFVEKAEKAREPQRIADVFWMLLNSAEFILNH